MALVYHLDASNPASWANAGTNPETWHDVSGFGAWASPMGMAIYETPTLVVDGAVKGLRLISASGGTYPNGTQIRQRGEMYIGSGNAGEPYGNTIGSVLLGHSYSITMWLKFNQAPISGSGSSGSDLPTCIFSSLTNSSPGMVFAANSGESILPRSSSALSARWYDASYASGPTGGNWNPALDQWYLVALVFERSGLNNGTLRFYVNGALIGSAAYPASTSPMFEYGSGGFTGLMQLNAAYTTSASPSTQDYGGDITFSTFKIFNTALSSAEITTTFSSESLAFGYAPGVLQNPQVMLRWSDDGGHTWSNEHWASMGALGAYGTRVIWRRLGMTEKLRDRVYEVSGTDPVKVSIVGAELSLSPTNA